MNDDVVLMVTGWKDIKKHIDRIPHSDFLDLTVCYLMATEVRKQGESLGYDFTTLEHDDAEKIGLSDPIKLYHMALENTERIFPPLIERIDDDIYCVTNSSHIFGASAILYDNVLESVADMIGSGMYVVPSSIHEVICVDQDKLDPSDLYDFIRYSNEQLLPPKDVLSGSLYYYDRDNSDLMLVYSENMC